MRIYISMMSEAEDLYDAIFDARRQISLDRINKAPWYSEKTMKAVDGNFLSIQNVYAGRTGLLELHDAGVSALLEAGAGPNGHGIQKVRGLWEVREKLQNPFIRHGRMQNTLDSLSEMKPEDWNALSPSDMLNISHAAIHKMIVCKKQLGGMSMSLKAAVPMVADTAITWASMERSAEEKVLPQMLRATYARCQSTSGMEQYEQYTLLAARSAAAAAFDLQRRENIRALIVEPGKPPRDARVDCSSEGALKELVGGRPKVTVLQPENVTMIAHSAYRKSEGLPVNRNVEGEDVHGTFVLTGTDEEGRFSSLSDKQVKNLAEKMKVRENVLFHEKTISFNFDR